MKLSKIICASGLSIIGLGACLGSLVVNDNSITTNQLTNTVNAKTVNKIQASSVEDFKPVYKDVKNEYINENNGFLNPYDEEGKGQVTYLQLFCNNKNIAEEVVRQINKVIPHSHQITIETNVQKSYISQVTTLQLRGMLINDSQNTQFQLLVALFANPYVSWNNLSSLDIGANNLTQLPAKTFSSIESATLNIDLSDNKLTGIYEKLFSDRTTNATLNISHNNIKVQKIDELTATSGAATITGYVTNFAAINLTKDLLNDIIIQTVGEGSRDIWPEEVTERNKLLKIIDQSQLNTYPLLNDEGKLNIKTNGGNYDAIEYSSNNMAGNVTLSYYDLDNELSFNESLSYNSLYIGLVVDGVLLGVIGIIGIACICKMSKKSKKRKTNKK